MRAVRAQFTRLIILLGLAVVGGWQSEVGKEIYVSTVYASEPPKIPMEGVFVTNAPPKQNEFVLIMHRLPNLLGSDPYRARMAGEVAGPQKIRQLPRCQGRPDHTLLSWCYK